MTCSHRIYYSKKYLKGKGIEFGALHSPLPYDANTCQVVYADKVSKDDLILRFPELRPISDSIIDIDLLFDLDSSDFSLLKKIRYDFFIANHIIEHLINPVQFLENIYDVMLCGSILYLSVPDRDYTFDKYRQLTSNEHLWNDYLRKEKACSIEHLNDFILNITKDHIEPKRRATMYFKEDKIPRNWLKRRKVYRLHRSRSIHVHVWNQKSFDDFLLFVFDKLQLNFKIIDSCRSPHNDMHEMIYILKKTSSTN